MFNKTHKNVEGFEVISPFNPQTTTLENEAEFDNWADAIEAQSALENEAEFDNWTNAIAHLVIQDQRPF